MNDAERITVTARWDRDRVPVGRGCQRHLLVEVTAPPKPEDSRPRRPINLALVLDRSGSMHGYAIDAARRAAAGVVEALDERDRLSLVIFDSRVEALLEGRAMTGAGRRDALAMIERVVARDATDLAGGWFEGSRCAAQLLDDGRYAEGRVLVLSDGYANRGICDPAVLQKHASELSGRGIRTSAIGIGANYSPLQLDALAEGGGGRLHDADTQADIVEVVLGELGDMHAVTARDVRVSVRFPRGVELDPLARAFEDNGDGTWSVPLGDIGAGARRPLALRAEVPACERLEPLPFEISVDWRHSPGQAVPGRESVAAPLHVVPAAEADAQQADRDIVEQIATLWEAVLAYRAMRRNEDHDYQGAVGVFEQAEAEYSMLVAELPDQRERLDRLQRSRAKVAQRWEGRSKLQSYTLSKKAMLAERDHRSSNVGEWHRHLDD